MAVKKGALKPHPKVKAAVKAAAVVLAVDGVIVALLGAIPSPKVLAILAAAHTVLPPLAGYLKSA